MSWLRIGKSKAAKLSEPIVGVRALRLEPRDILVIHTDDPCPFYPEDIERLKRFKQALESAGFLNPVIVETPRGCGVIPHEQKGSEG